MTLGQPDSLTTKIFAAALCAEPPFCCWGIAVLFPATQMAYRKMETHCSVCDNPGEKPILAPYLIDRRLVCSFS